VQALAIFSRSAAETGAKPVSSITVAVTRPEGSRRSQAGIAVASMAASVG
jgi:hypothetical protein